MKRTSLFVYFAAALIGLAAPAQKAAPPPMPAGERFLFVVDTSFSMKRLDGANRQALFDLIFHGLNGQMLPGDTYGIWTFDENIYAGDFPMQVWNPKKNLELASQAATFLKSRRYRSETRLQPAVGRLMALIQAVKDVNIFIVSDGDAALVGTSVDQVVNDSYKTRAEERRRAKKPFITTLVARNGIIVSGSVTIASEPIRLPERPAPVTIVKAPVAPPNVPSNTVSTVAETSVRPALQTKPPPAPIIMQGKPPTTTGSISSMTVTPVPTTPTNSAVPPSHAVSSATGAPEIRTATLLPVIETNSGATVFTNEPKQTALPDNSSSVALASVPPELVQSKAPFSAQASDSTPVSETKLTTPRGAQNPGENSSSAKVSEPVQPSILPPTPSSPPGSSLLPDALRVAARESSASTSVTAAPPSGLTAVAVAPQAFLRPRTMVFIGVGLVALAGGLLLWVVKRLRSAPQSSFISRSMDRE